MRNPWGRAGTDYDASNGLTALVYKTTKGIGELLGNGVKEVWRALVEAHRTRYFNLRPGSVVRAGCIG